MFTVYGLHVHVAKLLHEHSLQSYFAHTHTHTHTHAQIRQNIQKCRELLSRHAQQFRAIQKRLLTRFKDKTPVGLAHLDTLLDGTYMQVSAMDGRVASFEHDSPLHLRASLLSHGGQRSLGTRLPCPIEGCCFLCGWG